MANRPSPDDTHADEALTIAPEQVCFIIVKAREFDVKEANDERDSGSNPSDDREIEVLEDLPGDPVQQEIAEFISAMSEDEQIDLVALAWLGRDPDSTPEDWSAIREEAANAHASARLSTARYLLGIPTLGDNLEEAVSPIETVTEAGDIFRAVPSTRDQSVANFIHAGGSVVALRHVDPDRLAAIPNPALSLMKQPMRFCKLVGEGPR